MLDFLFSLNSPLLLKRRSDGTLVAGIAVISCATAARSVLKSPPRS